MLVNYQFLDKSHMEYAISNWEMYPETNKKAQSRGFKNWKEAIKQSLNGDSYAVLVDEKVVAVFGVVPETEDTAEIFFTKNDKWFEGNFKSVIKMIRESRKMIAAIREEFPNIHNEELINDETTVKFLQTLGFKVSEKDENGVVKFSITEEK